MAVLVVVVIILMISELGTSQSNNVNSSNIRLSCGSNTAMSSSSFFGNLNSTIDQLRARLSNNGVYYARAQNLRNEDSVYGLAQCRNYLSTENCVACFDVAVSAVESCSSANGANVFLDDCFLRIDLLESIQAAVLVGESSAEPGLEVFDLGKAEQLLIIIGFKFHGGDEITKVVKYENFDEFYDNPQTTMDVGVAPTGICGNQSTSQPIAFNRTVEELLSDIQIATPRTSNFYVASTRQVSSSNRTIYAVAQCIENTTQDICQNCLETAGSSKLGVIVGATVGVGIFLLISASSFWYKLRKKSKKDEDASELQGVKKFRYEDLQSATHNFSEEYRVGKGGYGEVFKAIVDDENVVAVKKLHVTYGKATTEFNNEVQLISNVRHRNLLRLLGWSNNGPELLIVLEYMPQGSLDNFLWGEKRGTLNWRQRFVIIFGIARGLAHLHEEFHVKIIHRDIKSSNILLDDCFQPKIADFGLARFQPEDQSHVSTRFAGTLGYTAPEYVTRGRLSEKVDTYSFGIVTLEIISGRRCTDVKLNGIDSLYLLEQAWQLYEKEIHIELIDEEIDQNDYEIEHVTKIIEIALMCTQSPAALRPSMSEVVLMLSVGQSLGRKQLTRPTFNHPDRRVHVDTKGLQKM
ncbi:hypothetical protein OSB04_027768 [Centaurea solstitialis]|uniref:Uncharacterized protein n=1 Tax=Centaurea solstitialis TaxID=347529 RepID=A0AA38W003_9ASTR|nr:hypothetical protein OSB04_027768 [Centaurea solstitialis]